MSSKRYTVDDLKSAVATSGSIRQVLLKLGLVPLGGSYTTIKRAIKKYNLDTSHFHGQLWHKGKKLLPKRPLSDYLVLGVLSKSHSLRLRLLREKVFDHLCNMCHNFEWNGKPIPLELDHINGDNQDNRLENLRLLCPNCHAQTTTYCRRKSALSKA